jgi:hypothetical protein
MSQMTNKTFYSLLPKQDGIFIIKETTCDETLLYQRPDTFKLIPNYESSLLEYSIANLYQEEARYE